MVLVYRRKTKENREFEFSTLNQLGHFVLANQPLEVIAIREGNIEEKQ